MPLTLFAGLPVRDHAAALPHYERLLGEPLMHPHATETVWQLAEDRMLYIVELPDAAGGGRALAMVDDLDARVAAIRARGVEPSLEETYANGVRKTTYRDADGNELAFGAMPA